MKFVVLEQKYLEHLEAGRVLDALHVLRNELTPLQHDTPRVHRLSALMMCADAAELRARAHWPGGAPARAAVLARVQVTAAGRRATHSNLSGSKTMQILHLKC